MRLLKFVTFITRGILGLRTQSLEYIYLNLRLVLGDITVNVHVGRRLAVSVWFYGPTGGIRPTYWSGEGRGRVGGGRTLHRPTCTGTLYLKALLGNDTLPGTASAYQYLPMGSIPHPGISWAYYIHTALLLPCFFLET